MISLCEESNEKPCLWGIPFPHGLHFTIYRQGNPGIQELNNFLEIIDLSQNSRPYSSQALAPPLLCAAGLWMCTLYFTKIIG